MKSSLCGAAILAFVVGATAVSHAQLGEIARQEEARRKTVKAAGKVYTNDSLQPAPQPSSESVPDTPPPTAAPEPTPAEGDAPSPSPAGDEAYWRKRVTDARDALSRAQTFQAALESQVNGLMTEFINRDDPAQRAVVVANRDKAIAELDRVKKEVQQYTRAISDVQEEARRAGVPAGWVR